MKTSGLVKTNDLAWVDQSGQTRAVRHLHFDGLRDAIRVPHSAANERHSYAVGLMDPDAFHVYDPKGRAWWGVETRREALRIIGGGGWSEGVARLHDNLSAIRDLPMDGARSVHRCLEWSSEGDEVDNDRLMSGQFDIAWRSRRRRLRAVTGRVVRLVNNAGASVRENAKDMFWTGAASVLLTDALEEAGYRVEIVTAAHGRGCWDSGIEHGLISVTVKTPEESVSMDQLAACLCLGGFFRLAILHAILTNPERATGSLGSPTEMTPALLTAAGLYQEGDIIVPILRSTQEAQNFLNTSVRALQDGPPAPAEPESRAPGSRDPAPMRSAPPRNPAPIKNIVAEGATYPHKETLKEAGFRWDGDHKRWVGAGDSLAIRTLVGNGLPGVRFSNE